MRYRSAGRVHHPFRGPSFRAALIVSFIAAAGFLFFGRSNTPVFDNMRGLVDGATGGLYQFVGPPIATARDIIGQLSRIFVVYGDNEKLHAENAKLEAWRAQALSLQQKVARYEALLGMPLEPDIQYRTGRVVDDPGGPFVRTFRINLGTENGVFEGQAVTDEHGLVGRIVAAGKTASRILLITDLNSRVPVMIEPTGVRGMLIGQNDAPPVVTYLPKDFTIQVGNTIVTSGHGGLLPPDIPVGTVTAIKDDHVVITPATNLSSVMYVRVLDYASPMADVPYSTKGPPILNSGPPLSGATPSPAANNAESQSAPAALAGDAPTKKPPRIARHKPTKPAQGTETPSATPGRAAAEPGDAAAGTASAALPSPPTSGRTGGFE